MTPRTVPTWYTPAMPFPRITLDPTVMGGKPCIRGLRVTVGTVLGLLASGQARERIVQAYPYLEADDLDAAVAYSVMARQVDVVERRVEN